MFGSLTPSRAVRYSYSTVTAFLMRIADTLGVRPRHGSIRTRSTRWSWSSATGPTSVSTSRSIPSSARFTTPAATATTTTLRCGPARAGFAAVQQVIDAALELRGVSLDAVFACAYHAEGRSPYDVAEHPWRKPRPGMILEALRRLNGLPERSALVGDQITDIEAARAGGVQTAVLIDRKLPASAAPSLVDAVVQSLGEAIAFLSSRDAS